MVCPAQVTMPTGHGKRSCADEKDTPATPHPTKKAKAPRGESRAAPSRRATTKNSASQSVAVSNAALPVAGPSNLRRSAPETEAVPVDELDSDSDTDDDDNHAHAGTGSAGKRTKLDRRTKVQVASVTRKDLLKNPCPVKGCETMLDPSTHDANRENLKLHYPSGALDVKASLPVSLEGVQDGEDGEEGDYSCPLGPCGPGVQIPRPELQE